MQQRPTDRAFDRFLPEDLRAVSMKYWTPLRVVKRAAEWLNDVNARHVVDIGSGAGKFCVATATLSRARFTGLEQSRSLVGSARALARVFGVNGRVTFVHGVFGAIATPIADVYYLYNPFGNYWFDSRRDGEPHSECTIARRLQEVAHVERFVETVPRGTYLLTYHGFGGRMPACCDLIRVDLTLAGGLRLWKKNTEA
jgi:SAM-dependent methyltransferase